MKMLKAIQAQVAAAREKALKNAEERTIDAGGKSVERDAPKGEADRGLNDDEEAARERAAQDAGGSHK